MKKRFLLNIAFVLFCFGVSAQISNESVTPPSPQTAAFDEYINYKVTLYNGVPDISIPLYTIHLKGMDVPVGISYHASGIKYHQTSGDVGLGWVLNPGYRVSRTIYGQADDRYDMPPSLDDSIASYQQGLEKDKFLSRFVNKDLPPNFPRPDNTVEHLDGAYDIFNYMLPSENGSFLITNRATKTIQTLDESNVKISYQKGLGFCSPTNGFLNFDVIDDLGNSYFFGERSTADLNVIESVPNDNTMATAWGLTNIVTALGDQLNFSYNKKTVTGWNYLSRTETIHEGAGCLQHVLAYAEPTNIFGDDGYQTFLLNEINSNNERVTLERNGAGFVTDLNVFNSLSILTRAVHFFYSGVAGAQIFLDSLQIKDKNLNTVQTYRFEYISKDYPYPLAVDQWGYNMNGNDPTALHSEFQDDSILRGAGTGKDPAYFYVSGFANRSSDNFPNWFSLKSITYPTGGRTEYEYEANRFQLSNGTVREGGGLRIKTITHYDEQGGAMARDYTYGDNGWGTATINIDESYFVNEKVSIEFDQDAAPYARRVVTYSSQMQGDVGVTGVTSNLVSYPKVTESISGGGGGKIVYYYNIGTPYEVGSLNHDMGLNFCQIVTQYYSPHYILGYRYGDRPLLTQKDYLNSGGSLVKRETYEYTTNISMLTGLKVSDFAMTEGYVDVEYNHTYFNFIGSFFSYNPYTITYGRNLLMNSKEIVYDQNGESSLVRNTDYQYNSKKQLSKRTTSLSNGEKRHSFISYPFDYASGSGFIDAMISRNIVAAPIEQVEAEENSSGNISILSGNIIKYKTSNAALKDAVLGIETGAAIPLSNFKFTNRSLGVLPSTGTATIFSPDNTYKTKATLDLYDGKNNLIQQTSAGNDIKSYIWDYDGVYPVAVVANSDANDIAYTSFETSGTGNWTFSGIASLDPAAITGSQDYILNGSNDVSKSGLTSSKSFVVSYWSKTGSALVNGVTATPLTTRNGWSYYEHKLSAGITNVTVSGAVTIDELRLYPSDAQMTSYTYTALIGMTSSDDIGSRITYYLYDNFGRLNALKNQDGNILKTIQYHYKGEVLP